MTIHLTFKENEALLTFDQDTPPEEGSPLVELDCSHLTALEERFHEIAAHEMVNRCIVDCRHIAFIDLAILRLLMKQNLYFKTKGGELALLSPLPHLTRLLRVTHLDKDFTYLSMQP